eukprot:gene1463-2813_t
MPISEFYQACVYIIIIQNFVLGTINEHENIAKSNKTILAHRKLPDWGQVFDGVATKNIILDCKFDGGPMCCSSLNKQKSRSKIHLDAHELNQILNKGHCSTTKVYMASPYEKRHFLKAQELAQIEDDDTRKNLLIDFISSKVEVQDAVNWISRVKIHMHADIPQKNSKKKVIDEYYTSDDFKYLSYFNVTEQCVRPISSSATTTSSTSISTSTWLEWIEPLSIHGRHPFGIMHVDNKLIHKTLATKIDIVQTGGVTDVDYILVNSGRHMTPYGLSSDGKIEQRRNYMFDAGTSRFDSSLWWFTCAYSQ